MFSRPILFPQSGKAAGYTIVEMLLATALSMVLMSAVVFVFMNVNTGIGNARRAIEAAERLRTAEALLRSDLESVTIARPTGRPEVAPGYFEYAEGGDWLLNPGTCTAPSGVNSETNQPDETVGQLGDVLKFTARNPQQPFTGRFGNGIIQSDVAEVCWYVRDGALRRRVLLVAPGAGGVSSDISAHGQTANNLSDLTKRENRFSQGAPAAPGGATDFWTPGAANGQATDDIVLRNILSFDVKAWDPGAPLSTTATGAVVGPSDPGAAGGNGDYGAYVDLGYENADYDPAAAQAQPMKYFNHKGDKRSGLTRTYDTGSTHLENEGNGGGKSSNGFDDDGNGIVDDVNETISAVPYPVPLKGIQIKIRVMDPESRHIREVTVIQDFTGK